MIDLITVVFKDELPLLHIQAESISQYINPEDINTITIVVNDTDDVANQIDTLWWKFNAGKVQIKKYSKWNYISRITGWENQQICKLLAASEANSEWSMVLDAKTWFIDYLNLSQLFTNGKSNSGLSGISPHFVSSQKFVEQYYNVTMPQVIGPAGVPFMFHTDTVYSMIQEFDDFPEFFQTNVRFPNLITEFHLYSGYVLHKYGTYATLYNKTHYYNVCNICHSQANDFNSLIKVMRSDPQLLTASIHRKVYNLLSPEQLLEWNNFLKEKHLITHDLEFLK